MKYDGVQGREALVQEKIREDRIRGRGWGLDRVVWQELANVPLLAQRLSAAAAKHSM